MLPSKNCAKLQEGIFKRCLSPTNTNSNFIENEFDEKHRLKNEQLRKNYKGVTALVVYCGAANPTSPQLGASYNMKQFL